MHQRIKSNPDKYAQFCARTAEAVKREWQNGKNKQNIGGFQVHCDDVDAFLSEHGWIPPWTQKQLSEIFEVA